MKVVFLDIDGVLNEKTSQSRCCGYRGIDDKKVKTLAKIVKATEAKIVLVSTWKEGWQREEKGRQTLFGNYLDRKMKKQGLKVFDKTEDVDREAHLHLSRGEGILQYLRRHAVKKYVVIDDCQFDYDGCGLTDFYLRTDEGNGGLTEEIAQKAIAILKG